MIAFLTLFLGLVAGPQRVEVSVVSGVSRVEILLDDAVVASLDHAPWSAKVDLGLELSPHALIARAFNDRGEEIGRARQWLNLPRPPAELEILLDRDAAGRATAARFVAGSLLGPRPTRLTATLDEKPLGAFQDDRIGIPAYEGSRMHLLTVAAEYPNGVEAHRDLVLGSGTVNETAAELTSVPVRVTGSSPAAAKLAGWFAQGGQPLPVVAAEHGPAEIFVVRDLSRDEAWEHLGSSESRAQAVFGRGFTDRDPLRREMQLSNEDRVRFLWPVLRVAWGGDLRTELFETSHDFLLREGGLAWLLTHVDDPHPASTSPRFADGVAIAGLQAAATRGRRAVLLVLGASDTDASRLAPALVRRYLERLRVPLFVWSFAGPGSAADPWGGREDASDLPHLREAYRRLKNALDAQWIVWLSGEHRPQDIVLSRQARGLELVP